MVKLNLNLDDIPDFVGMDPGKHVCKLLDCTKEVSSKDNDMLVWEWEGTEGENEGKTIRSYTSLLDNALSGLKTHLKAFGFDGDSQVDTDKLKGKKALLVVVMRKYRDRDSGEEKEGSSVSNVLPVDGASKASGKGKAGVVSVGEDDSDIPF